MIIVRLPAMLRRPGMPADVRIEARVGTIGALVRELDARYAGLARELDDTIFNFAVNDQLVLRGANHRSLTDGDVVEIIPMISGGLTVKQ
jgi:molybdopterin converting factor small subunit